MTREDIANGVLSFADKALAMLVGFCLAILLLGVYEERFSKYDVLFWSAFSFAGCWVYVRMFIKQRIVEALEVDLDKSEHTSRISLQICEGGLRSASAGNFGYSRHGSQDFPSNLRRTIRRRASQSFCPPPPPVGPFPKHA
jgi:hypothetical protein